MEKVTKKIEEFRKTKGYSYETMAFELKTSPSAYRKIETNQTKLTVERLFEIATILETSVAEILEIEAKEVYNQENKDNSTGYLQKIEHFYADNKEVNEKFIKSLQDEVLFLRKLLEEK